MSKKAGCEIPNRVEAFEQGIYLDTHNKTNRAKDYVPTDATILRVRQAADMLADGKSDKTVRKWFAEEFGLGRCSVEDYMGAVYRYLTPKDWNEEKERVVVKNLKRLETMVEKCMAKENYKTAKECIDSINKMFGLTGNAVCITKTPDGAENITINFE